MKNDHVPSPSNCKTCRENPSATSHSFLCEPLALKAFKGFQKHGGHPADEGQKYPFAFKLQGEEKNPSATSHSFLCEPLALKVPKDIQKHGRHPAYKEQKQSPCLVI